MGKINGKLIVYYKTGIKKSVTNYKDGVRHGRRADFYKNGALLREDDFVSGKVNGIGKSYSSNGPNQAGI